MPNSKKPYIPPRLTKYSSLSDLPEPLQKPASELLSCVSKVTVICDKERRYQSVSPGFATLLGYAIEELQGKRVDDITAPDSLNAERVFEDLLKLGEMDGLWLFQDRQGKRKLFRYHARQITDQLMFAELEQLPMAS